MRRYLIIAITAVAVIVVIAVVYFYFFTGQTGVTNTPTGNVGLPVAENMSQNTKTNGMTGRGSDINTTRSTGAPSVISARLVKISAGPVVPGEIVVDKKAINASSSPETIVNFIERGSGNVFSYSINTKTLTRTNNKTIPGIQSASWLPDGSTAFVRYLSGNDFSTINTYALSATSSSGFFLQQNLSGLAVSSAGVLMLASGVNGSVVSLARADGSHSSSLFTMPLTALHVSFFGKNQYLVFPKPSAVLQGDAFIANTAGRFYRIAGPHNGLVALSSPSGKWVLVSYTLGSAIRMELVNAITNETLQLPVATIADKCVWTSDDLSIYCGIPMNTPSDSAYPDDWYQGAIQFADRIWKIQVSGRYAQLVLDFSKETNSSLDIESPAINSSGSVLVFVNKKDGSLWSYSL